jgi:hypothetical protein
MAWSDSRGWCDGSEEDWAAATPGRGPAGSAPVPPQSRTAAANGAFRGLAAARRGGSQRRPGHAPCCRSCRSPRQAPCSACRRCLPNALADVPGRAAPAAGHGPQQAMWQCLPKGDRNAKSPTSSPGAGKPTHRAASQRGVAWRWTARRGRPRQPEATSVAASIGVEVAGGAAVVNLRSGWRPCRVVNGALSTAECRQCAIADPWGQHATRDRSDGRDGARGRDASDAGPRARRGRA